jgi:hypothetical protein
MLTPKSRRISIFFALLLLLVMAMWLPGLQAKTRIDLQTRHGSAAELAVRDRLAALLEKYPLERWVHTRQVVIDDNANPSRSHPVLTLGTRERFLGADIELVAVFVHEQLHWHIVNNSRFEPDEATARLKPIAVGVRSEPPFGSGDDGSTMNHVTVCYMEYRVLSQLFGPATAKAYLLAQPFYTDVYAFVVDPAHEASIEAVLRDAGVSY